MEVVFTEMAVNCLLEIESLAVENYSEEQVATFIDGLVNRNYEAIFENSERYRYNATLLDFGIKFQERLDSSYRCLYEVIGNKAHVMLILQTKQDLISALYRHQIIKKFN
ncbi:type II toxin-antitoxin system RelE/ParE family toxin [Vibrio sp. VB16]|uniref:type II toxin-antitoxin system RelE/ParE family toxin n=1 Tax=Vibrio sp. VB16 TaxID=2785746 RepID=UPI0018A0BA60|nr:type II toxin-antitoxin system RelE/ParE family toxin [Vibrio sp. VB16]UGA53356.1 type II toxin-antitoxin system RelE/ParE family toxin [Vibrio sp. VB16]